ncbi:MAG: AMP-binding protein, partial [Acidimicrobiales bacterium]
MPGWNFADVWETIADQLPAAPAQVQGDRRCSWRDFDRRADGIARVLLDAGVQRQDKVAQYLYNCPEYLESMFAVFKAGLVPINTNYRYGDDELVYLWDNADAVAVVFHGLFSERIDRLRARLQRVRAWLWVDDGSGPCPDWAVPYEEAASATSERAVPPWSRDGDDLYMLYTGGTTGMPKGVMWRQDDLFANLNGASPLPFGDEPDLAKVRQLVTAPSLRQLPAAPLMHGTGCFTALTILSIGGSIVLLPSRSFDAVELLDITEREKVNAIAWVGDAFAKPVLRALDEHPGRWDLSSLVAIVSSGVMWSEATKQGLLRHHPGMLLADMYSSSEALGLGRSVSSAGGTSHTAAFILGENARVLTD